MTVSNLKTNITNEQVDAAIAAFVSALTGSKAAAQAAAVAALVHCYQHRTAAKLRELMNVIATEGKDFVRLAPFTFWLATFAPVKMVAKEVDGKKERVLEFDKDSALLETADATIEAATAKLWWTMTREKEAGAFDVIGFDKRILGIARKALADLAEQPDADPLVLNHVQGVFAQFERYVEAGKSGKIVTFNSGKKPEKKAA
jgi:hypothetical protein